MSINTEIARKYKNAEIVYIVEDNLITTGKVYIGKDCIVTKEYSCEENEEGLPFSGRYAKEVISDLRGEVDTYINTTINAVTR